MFRTKLLCSLLAAVHALPVSSIAQSTAAAKAPPFVNQAGYNTGEAKRFTVPGAADGTAFTIRRVDKTPDTDGEIVYRGAIKNQAGEFTAFDPPNGRAEYVVEVDGHGRSVPFWIADHLMERLSSKLAYQFFIDVRGGTDPKISPAKITGGGPSRDGGGQTLEATYEGLLYASNPALFERWADEMAPATTPDLIDLILWHAEFCYNNIEYNGTSGGEAGVSRGGYERWVREFGHPRGKLQNFDYQNMLDQLAAVSAFYHSFLKPYMSEATYQKYRRACLDRWEAYERQKEVRYWVKSKKWIDSGWMEFSEQGNAFGQGLLRNLLMYVAERNEPNGQPDRFLRYAQECAADIIKNWDFTDPRQMWAIRNAEHITPQALALFLLIAPDKAPPGAREKLVAYRDYIIEHTDNLWHYRKHYEHEWAHPTSKEVGTVAGLGGSIFAAAHLLDDAKLRGIGWSQVNFVFGVNPTGAHLSHKSEERVKLGGYWEGVERGWMFSQPDGTGKLGAVRGTLDGSPLNNAFPYNPQGVAGDYYSTEGWAITNRAWLSTVMFSTLGSHRLRLIDPRTKDETTSAKSGDTVRVELKAALNQDPEKTETGWVEVINGATRERLTVTETAPDSGIFAAEFKPSAYLTNGSKPLLTLSYGYMGFDKRAELSVTP